MGKVRDRFLGTGPELIAARDHLDAVEQRGLKHTGLIVDAYFQGIDPVNGNELSEEFRASLAPIALSTLDDEISSQVNIRTRMRQGR